MADLEGGSIGSMLYGSPLYEGLPSTSAHFLRLTAACSIDNMLAASAEQSGAMPLNAFKDFQHNKTTPETISGLISKVFRGGMPPDPLAAALRALYYALPSRAIKCTLETPFSNPRSATVKTLVL